MGIGLEGMHKGREVTGGMQKALWALLSHQRSSLRKAESIFSSILPVWQGEDKGCMS